jgi:hypothetical protein
VDTRVEVCWTCAPCEVEGRDVAPDGAEPSCWNCGGPVVITARPTIRTRPLPGTS